MRYFALATDYDGTLAHNGRVSPASLTALERLRASGRRLILVTGRQVADLAQVFPQTELFDHIVAENGAVLYRPADKTEALLTEPPSEKLVGALRARGVQPLSVGKAVIATWHPHETLVLELIRELGLELQVIFNKGAVMVLPSGVNKWTGLTAALEQLQLSAHNAVAVGDAENDHAFMSNCECSIAVSNALPAIKERADIVTAGDHGDGVIELIDHLLHDDLEDLESRLRRHEILLGRDAGGNEARLRPYRSVTMVSGPSGSGKSNVIAALLERIQEQEYQACVIDPEGDYESFEDFIQLGKIDHVPAPGEVERILEQSKSVVINLLGVPLSDRPSYFAGIVPAIQRLRARTGRPHWLIVDEAHHLLPASSSIARETALPTNGATILITVRPGHLAPIILDKVDALLVAGNEPNETITEFAQATGRNLARVDAGRGQSSRDGQVWLLPLQPIGNPVHVSVEPAKASRQRHRRKYAEGDLHDRSFYFRGRHGKLNLRASNLNLFSELAEGVDDDTFLYHLQRGDYSKWVRSALKDEALAAELALIERAGRSPAESRTQLREAIERRYTGAA